MQILRLCAAGALAVCAIAQSGMAITVGGREWTFPLGPFAPADAPLSAPNGLATSPEGTLYVADQTASVVVAIQNGVSRRVAGNGVAGYSGDGLAATDASLNGPGPLAVGPDSSVYIADLWNYRIRRVAPDGTMSTIAGNGTFGACADGAPASGPCVGNTGGLAVDSDGNLYFSDSSDAVYKITGGVISLYAGGANASGIAQLFYPESLAIDGQNNIYVLQSLGAGVKMITPGGVVSIVAMGGEGAPAGITAIAVSANATLYATYAVCQVLKFVPGTVAVEMASACFAGDGFGMDQRAIAVDAAGNVYVADDATQTVRQVSPLGTVTTLAGNHEWYYTPDASPATAVALGGVTSDFVVLPSRDVIVAGAGRIRRITPTGAVVTMVEFGSYDPVALAVAPNGDLLFADNVNCVVRRIDAAGAISTFAGRGDCVDDDDGSPATGAGLAYPRALAFDEYGRLFVATASAVRRIDTSNMIETVAGGPNPTFQDNVPATQSNMNPQALTFQGGTLLIADILNLRIRAVDAQGTIYTVAGNGNFNDGGDDGPALARPVGQVWSMSTDAQGNVWFADSTWLRKLDTSGVISTIQGRDWGCSSCLLNVKAARVSGSTVYAADWPVIRKLVAGGRPGRIGQPCDQCGGHR
jgi:sugar lactone lactonase YvrE